MISLPATLPSFFQMQETLETRRNSNLRNFGGVLFGDEINVKFIF